MKKFEQSPTSRVDGTLGSARERTTPGRSPRDNLSQGDKGRWRKGLFAATVLGTVVGIAIAAALQVFPKSLNRHVGPIELAALLGAVAGASELVSRYRDEPMRAVSSGAGALYISLNAAISVAAYLLLVRYGEDILPGLADDPVMAAVVAGFGAMALLRSKFFTLRTEKGEELAVGPDAALEAILAAANRGVDRSRAARRLRLVPGGARAIRYPDRAKAFIETALSAFQNVSDTEANELKKRLNAIVSV